MEYFAGIDLGKRASHVRVITKDRTIVQDVKIENNPQAFKRVFARFKGKIEVGCEASTNAFWVADTIAPLVRKVSVGHPTKIRWIAEARIKTDKIDAGIIAELIRADLFPRISIPPPRIRDLRELTRGLVRLRRQATRCRNQVHGLLGRHGIPYKRADVTGPKLGELVRSAELPAPALVAAEALVRLEEAICKEQKGLQREIQKAMKGDGELQDSVKLLESIPGVGFFSAAMFALELWDVERFKDSKHLASYMGLAPSTHQSGDRMWHGRMTRHGNPFVRWILVQDAWAAMRCNLFFGQLYERHKKGKGGAKAIIPVARALLNTIHRVWTERRTYQELYDKKALVG